MAQSKAIYKRVQLKLSGEGLAGSNRFGLSSEALMHVAGEIQQVHALGVQIGITVGGGNMIRGATLSAEAGIAEATAHYMGMLATVINAMALQEVLGGIGVETRVMSTIHVSAVCEAFDRRRCLRHFDKGRVVVMAGGTGRPFVTTDTAAAVAAVEIGADALLKATQVDGVYSADPKTDPKAEFYPTLRYDRAINERLKVMDISAMDVCQRNNMPIVVFNLHQPGNIKRVVLGEKLGTVVS